MRFADDSNLRVRTWSRTGDRNMLAYFFLELFSKRWRIRVQNLRHRDIRRRRRGVRDPFGGGGLRLVREDSRNWLFRDAFEGCGEETLDRPMAFGHGRRCFLSCRHVRCLPQLVPLRDFQEGCQFAARLRKCVEDIGKILRAELKLPGSESKPEDVVDFTSLAFGEILLQSGIDRAVLIILFPLKNSLAATGGFLIQFLLLLSCCGTSGERFRLTVG